MNTRILFFLSYHASCLQPFLQGTSSRCFYSSHSHRLILVVWTARRQMHFPFCLQMSQNLKKSREGKSLCCSTRASSLSRVIFLIFSLLVILEWISLPIFLTGSLVFMKLNPVWKQECQLNSCASCTTWQESILGWPFCLDLPQNSLLASDLDYFISARSHYGQV